MQRRRFLTLSAAAAASATAAASLGGCGFALRGSAKYPFKSVFLQAPEASPLARQLQRTLEGAGLTVLRTPSDPALAERVFELLQEQHERAVVSQTSSGAVREMQLRLRVLYRLRDGDGLQASASAQGAQVVELLQTRELSYDESQALSKEAEQELLFKDMQTELVAQIVRRLAH
ncbi:hypothetical protein EBQ34_12875 [Vandammella animalimorsus]|uniref:LPS-assembly lipoprotein LptE n=1 Tax=Vandammella animalimorsus TaxID=2029117 RepID=A0A3M6R471_9BURK|nr:LPS assembly lipoprotein LptE [Vandammella animalimorsus]RMX10031.1 hypothetical protein EBQ34_12875 [Vandammella animalimorsus]